MRILLNIGFIFALAGTPVLAQTATQAPPAADTERKPITEQQLRTYLETSLLLPAFQQQIMAGLPAIHKSLPPWFPDKVWHDAEQAIAKVDLPHMLLPLYQRYFTQQDGDAIILRFSGPTGHDYAQAALDERVAAVNHGLAGSAAERAAEASPAQKNVDRLLKEHLATLSPGEVAQINTLAAAHPKDVGFKIDDEQNVLLNAKLTEVLHAVFAADDAQLKAAQRAYQAKH